MKRTSKHLLCLLLALAMMFTLTAPAYAEEANPGERTVDYLRYDEESGEFVEDQTACVVIDSSSSALSDGWYVVDSEVTIADRIEIDGVVNLVLADGAKLTAKQGIHLAEGNELSIYPQSGGTGELIAKSKADYCAGIGGNRSENGGSITIHGGAVTTSAGYAGAGIGAGFYGSGGSITINGGTVTATGGDSGAGIGGSIYGTGGNITINGGLVTANGGFGAAGIGGGDCGSGGSITINGGTVTATSGSGEAGIGGGFAGENGTLTVAKGLVVKGGESLDSLAVLDTSYSTRPMYMTVTTADQTSYLEYDADSKTFTEKTAECVLIDEDSTALSGGWYAAYGEITVTERIEIDGTVNLILADHAKLTAEKGIHLAEGNTLNIFAQSGGTGELIATAEEECCAGIGSNYSGNDLNLEDCGTVTIHGGIITANGADSGPGIGGGIAGDGGVITINGGTVTANGGDRGAGIGGGEMGNGGIITITGGTVTANGGESGAGIGSGWNSGGAWFADGGSVTITGGSVTATGGYYGAGIGGGVRGPGSSVEINGGSVTAIAGAEAAGIGGGCDSSGNGTLVAGENVIVKGGADKDSLEALEAPFETRPAYMTVFDPMISYLEYDVSSSVFTGKTAECALIDGASTALSSGWYVAYGEVTIPDRIEIDGEVNLILADYAKLTAEKGIHLIAENELNIFGQTEGTGQLIASGPTYDAGIGGNYDDASAGTVTIHGGTVTANGGWDSAGIGGSNNSTLHHVGCSGGNVTIYGGTVTATGDDGGAGIGGGRDVEDSGTIEINGGTVTATGGTYAAGIGGGLTSACGTIVINGGTVTAYGAHNGAGIGGGYGARTGGSITINGGAVKATGGSSGAGIGGGNRGAVGSITIYDGTVTANGGDWGAGIGSGSCGIGGNVTIYGGTVTATGGKGSAGIGGESVYTEEGSIPGAINDAGGNVTINGGIVTATGGRFGAGIGGSADGSGGRVTINGGDVTADGGPYSAGIGGGTYGYGGTIVINGGAVRAAGGDFGAGIGGGYQGDCGSVTVTGGSVIAIAGEDAVGIGCGKFRENNGTLEVAAGLVVKGGADADSRVVMEAPYEPRLPYMTVGIGPRYSYVWSWDGDEPAVTLKLVWPDGKVDEITMDIDTDVSESDNVVTYTASIKVDGTIYTTEKTVQLSYDVQVTGGEITSGLKDSYSYGDKIIVTAGPAPEGKIFAGWLLDGELVSTSEVYGRSVDRSFTLEATYTDQPVEVKPVVTASDTDRILVASTGKYKTTLSVSWSVPSGFKLVEAGLIRAYGTSEPSLDTLLSEGTKKASTLTNANGTYNLGITMAATKKDYGLYYVGYLTCKNANGQTTTIYTEIGCNEPIQE